MTYDNIKIRIEKKKQNKKQGLILSLKNTFLEKQGANFKLKPPAF